MYPHKTRIGFPPLVTDSACMSSTEKQTPRRDKHKPSRPAEREPSLEEQVPPSNIEVERELIGCLLLDGGQVALEKLQPADFHDEFNAFLFTTIRDAWRGGVALNTKGTLLHWMSSTGKLREAKARFTRDAWYHLGCMMQTGLVCNLERYCLILRELRKKRAAKYIGTELLKKAVQDDVTAEQWRSDVSSYLKDFDKL